MPETEKAGPSQVTGLVLFGTHSVVVDASLCALAARKVTGRHLQAQLQVFHRRLDGSVPSSIES